MWTRFSKKCMSSRNRVVPFRFWSMTANRQKIDSQCRLDPRQRNVNKGISKYHLSKERTYSVNIQGGLDAALKGYTLSILFVRVKYCNFPQQISTEAALIGWDYRITGSNYARRIRWMKSWNAFTASQDADTRYVC